MKLKIWIAILSFLTVFNLAAIGTFLLLHSTRKPGDRDFRHAGPRGAFFDRDRHGLPREKWERLTTLIREFRDETRDLRARADELENDIVELMQEDHVDRAAVDSLLEEVSAVRLEIGKKATDKMIEAKEFLSLEQQEVFYHAILRSRPGGPPGRNHRR